MIQEICGYYFKIHLFKFLYFPISVSMSGSFWSQILTYKAEARNVNLVPTKEKCFFNFSLILIFVPFLSCNIRSTTYRNVDLYKPTSIITLHVDFNPCLHAYL